MEQFHHFINSQSRKQRKGNNSNREYLESWNGGRRSDLADEDEEYINQEQEEDVDLRFDKESDREQQEQGGDEERVQEEDDIDPLDAFMTNLEKSAVDPYLNDQTGKSSVIHSRTYPQYTSNHKQTFKTEPQNSNGIIEEGESEQDQHFYRLAAETDHIQNASQQGQKQRQEFFEDGNLEPNGENYKSLKAGSKEKKVIETLQPLDFSNVDLQDFQKDFYEEHQDITRLTEAEVSSYRKQFDIKCKGTEIPRPIISFGHLDQVLGPEIKKVMQKQQFQRPTPIQSQALPIALSGRDMVGVAKTGSGKTLAFVWPLITHVAYQRESKRGEGPIGLLLAPTRELCQQIYLETKKNSRKFEMKIACILGGENKHEQWKSLKAGVDIVIASPGRLIEMIKKKATNLLRVTFVVLDEADKMLSLGFEQQIRSIVSQTRPDRQTLLFTATMKKSIQFLAYDILDSPIVVKIGEQNSANEDVKQQVEITATEEDKFGFLAENLLSLLTEGKVLIFCNQKDKCEQIKQFIQTQFPDRGITALTLYGDKTQYERTMIMNEFKSEENGQSGSHMKVLIATDIAGRGIDVKNIKTVVNFECPKNIETYIHRIGRAGRAGETGTAISFLNEKSQKDIKFSIELIKIFENSGYPVSKELQDLACMDDFYKRKRISTKMGVSFAKGKDASKYLNQILKKQQMGNSRAGLGMTQAVQNYGRGSGKSSKFSEGLSNYKSNFDKYGSASDAKESEEFVNQPPSADQSIADLIREKQELNPNLTISEISRLIKEQVKEQKQHRISERLNSRFARSSSNNLFQSQAAESAQGNRQPDSLGKSKKAEITIEYYKGRSGGSNNDRDRI